MTVAPVRLGGLLVLLALLTAPAGAQEFGRIENTQAAAPGYFYFARPGQAVVSVTATGGVGTSGRYFLGAGATVSDLLALSGGVRPSAGVEDPSVRLYRAGGVAYDAPLRSAYGPGSESPTLQDGDVVEVTVPLVSTAPGFHVHAEPGAETVVVTAAGALAAPGRYVLDAGSTVGDLVALAGGGREATRESNQSIEATVRLYRGSSVAYESALADLYGRPTEVLQAGDVVDLQVVIDERSPFTWRDVVSILTGAAAVVLAVDRAVGG